MFRRSLATHQRVIPPVSACPTLCCLALQIVFNTRRSHSTDDNSKLFNMDDTGKLSQMQFAIALGMTHALYDNYTRANPDHAFHVYMEDMYDPQVRGGRAALIARALLCGQPRRSVRAPLVPAPLCTHAPVYSVVLMLQRTSEP